jgi:hypothetical protein
MRSRLDADMKTNWQRQRLKIKIADLFCGAGGTSSGAVVAIIAARHARALARLAHDADPSIIISDAPIAELTALGAQPTSAFMPPTASAARTHATPRV